MSLQAGQSSNYSTRCLARNPSITNLTEGIDFYQEGCWVVYTAEYHLKRGFCCHSGCRHCPYGYRDDTPQKPEASSEQSYDNGNN
ncbi:MAG: DUF5522 domain-containing protein [Methylobacter sp.]